jgi:iron-sulfur cluster assembly protein
MITLTKAAADQVRKSAEASNAGNLPLRVAARVDDDGSIHYGMGFDEPGADDVLARSEGVEIVVAEGLKDMLLGMKIDYVELSPGEFHFIFSNPNDPNHKLPPSGQH